MRQPYERDIKKEMLSSCFRYLVDKGLENASIKNLCEETGISSGSIYYWFKDKNEVVLDSTTYGLNEVTEKLFNYAFIHIGDVKKFIETFPEQLMLYKKELRFIFQVTTSNQYGKKMRLIANKLDFTYDAYAMKLAQRLNCDYETLQPFVYLFISAAFDYIVWEDKFKIDKELHSIYKVIQMLPVQN